MAHATRQDAHDPGNRRDVDWQERAFDLLRGIAAYTGNDLVSSLARVVGRYPEARLDVAFNHKQIASKAWARDQLFETLGGRFERLWIMGGWYGVFAAMILDDRRFSVGEVASLDIDPTVAAVACLLNAKASAEGRFRAVTADMCDIEYTETPDLIVNTSCEHIRDLRSWLSRIPAGTNVLLQSNNYFAEPEHVSCMPSLAAFKEHAGLSRLLFAGELQLRKYIRFMLIGRS